MDIFEAAHRKMSQVADKTGRACLCAIPRRPRGQGFRQLLRAPHVVL